MSETLIVVPLDNGVARPDRVVHLPAPGVTVGAYQWTSVCGKQGVVYVKGGPFAGSGVCRRCSHPRAKLQHPRVKWTPELCVEAIRRWGAEHDGQPPKRVEWRYRGADHPTEMTVAKVCGTWAAAVEAAGFVASPAGRPRVVHPHGTEARYYQGCRDECCRTAHAAAARERYRAARPWLGVAA